MARAKDLDTIAPDDPIITPQKDKQEISKEITKKKSSKKTTKGKKSKTKKTKKKKSSKMNAREKACQILGRNKNCFSSFLINPKVFDFIERKKGEEILLAIRPHWTINIKWFLIAIIMAFAPLLVSNLHLFGSLPLKYQIVSFIFWYLIIFIYIFEKFLDWYFDVFVVTDRRLVDIKFNNLLNKHFAEAELGVIQDVSSSVKGLLGTFFNYGTVLVQTASDTNQIIFINVPNPGKIIQLLQELRADYQKKYRGGKL